MTFHGRTLALALLALGLVSCGGGGGDGGTFSQAQNGTITLQADRTALPVNPDGVLPYSGSPYLAAVNVTFRSANGTIESPSGPATFTISPPTVATISPPDDPTTADINELQQRSTSFPQTLNNGSGTVFVNAFNVAGTAVLTASAVDPQTNVTVSKSLTFTVSSGVGPQPAQINLSASPSSVYLPDSGAAATSTITAQVLDGAGQAVPNPTSGNGGVDNIQFEIVGDANGATLSASSVGGSVSGSMVTTHTINGIATVSFSPGTEQGPVQIKATVDASDNNVSNGIAQPVVAATTVVVSDGKLYSLVITSPTTSAIQVNPVSDNVTPTDGNTTTPPNPDGTYSLTVSAIATDRQGNPVLPGTPIEFGVVDAPISGFPNQGSGIFTIAGPDGNPQESGINFSAPTGHFRNAGPGDTLLVFGKLVTGNRDLESARQVQSIVSDSVLSVTYPFNPNDDSGVSVDSGAVIPYIIGHAEEGNIGATGTTDAHGVAHTTLNYPVRRIGKGAYIWARGAGALVPATGRPRLVTDISGGGFPGVAPATLSVSQTPLPGNTSVSVTVCLYDALGAPIQGFGIGFGFTNLGLGTGSIDGVSTSGTFAVATGGDGCTSGTMLTSGLSGGGTDSPAVTFTAGPGTDPLPVPITVSGNLLLQASPSAIGASGGSVTLLLTDANGNPVPGAQLTGTCTGGAGLSGLVGTTDAAGHATAGVTASGIVGVCPGTAPNTGSCVFSTGLQGGPTTTVTVNGGLLAATDPSCQTGTTPPANPTLTVTLDNGPDGETISATSTPPGLTCSASPDLTVTCTAVFPTGTSVTLSVNGDANVEFSGDCIGTGTRALVVMSGDKSCAATSL